MGRESNNVFENSLLLHQALEAEYKFNMFIIWTSSRLCTTWSKEKILIFLWYTLAIWLWEHKYLFWYRYVRIYLQQLLGQSAYPDIMYWLSKLDCVLLCNSSCHYGLTSHLIPIALIWQIYGNREVVGYFQQHGKMSLSAAWQRIRCQSAQNALWFSYIYLQTKSIAYRIKVPQLWWFDQNFDKQSRQSALLTFQKKLIATSCSCINPIIDWKSFS